MSRLRSAAVKALCVMAVIAAGLSSAVASAWAAVPDRWGFAYVNITGGVPDLAHQAWSWAPGPNVTVTPGVVGEVLVRFPSIGGPGGVVHVTAVSTIPQWCQVEKWFPSGADEIAVVRCYKYGGAPAFTPFSIVYEASSGMVPPPAAFGYVYWDGTTVATQFNSALAVNSVSPTSTGVWTVTLPGLGSSGLAGNIQVTAVNSSVPARCKVSGWAPTAAAQKIQVRCHNATSVPLDTGWTLTYHRERAITGGSFFFNYLAYTFDNTPANPGPYSPVPPAVNYNSQGSVNDIQSAGTGLRLVTFHKVGVLQDDVQVTAFGPGPEFCNLISLWGTVSGDAVVRDIACYNAGVRVNQPSLSTYVSAR